MPATDGSAGQRSFRRGAKGAPFRLTAPTIREHPRHKQIADVLCAEIAPAGRVSPHGAMWFSIDISDYGGAVPGTRTARGVVAGLPDLWFLWLGNVYVVEIKTDVGIASFAQRSMLAGMTIAGCRVAVARDAVDVLAIIDQWGIPRANRVRL